MELLTIDGFLGATDSVTRLFLDRIYPALAGLVAEPVYSAAVIYWALSGYRIFAGYAALEWYDMLAKVVMTVSVFGVLNWGGLAAQLYDLFVSFMNTAAATILAGEPATDLLSALFLNADHIARTLRGSGIFQVNAIIEGTLLLIINSLLFAVALFYMTLAKIGLAITMVLLPLFIGFALFEGTRQWCVNWLSKMLDFALVYILVVAIVKLGFMAFEQFIAEINQTAALIQTRPDLKPGSHIVVNVFIIEAVLAMFMLQVREWAGYLSSGAASSGEAMAMKFAGHVRR